MKTQAQVWFVAAVVASSCLFATGAENIARGKTYRFSRPANYKLCGGPEDSRDLTDGVYAPAGDGSFLWMKKECVGWQFGAGLSSVCVTVDLGEVADIGGFSWHYAAGASGVGWPRTIYIYTSEDAKTWACVGDLLAMSVKRDGGPQADRYRDYRAWSMSMPARGRYVTFAIEASTYTFCDELEVYAGDSTKAKAAHEQAFKVSNPAQHMQVFQVRESVLNDLKKIGVTPDAKVQQAVDDMLKQDIRDVRTIFPMSEAHAQVWALNAKRLGAAGFIRPVFWQNNRWANLDPLTVPNSEATRSVAVEIEMMRGEVRSETVNLLNPTDRALECTIDVTGLPAEANIVCHEVLVTDTRQHVTTSAALVAGEGPKLRLKLPAGASRQIWFSCVRPTAKAGAYTGMVQAKLSSGASLSCPFRLRLAPLDYPARPRLLLYGWDYSMEPYGSRPTTEKFMQSHLALMRDIGMNVAWEPMRVLPSNAKFAADGALENADALDFAAIDRWLARFPDARAYAVYIASEWRKDAAGEYACFGEKVGTERFKRMVGEFFRAVANHLIARGKREEDLMICFVDEPGEWQKNWQKLGDLVNTWSDAVRVTCPKVRFFQDPTYKDPHVAPTRYWQTSDIYCPPAYALASAGPVRDFYEGVRKSGKALFTYRCAGPSRLLDPITYYRGSAYIAFRNRAAGIGFWAFGHGAGVQSDSWHAYTQSALEYSPYFVSPEGATPTKQSEGIREGVEDFEYMLLLTDRIRTESAAGRDVTALKKLLREGVDPIVAICGDDDRTWSSEHNHAAMDTFRLRLLHALESNR